MMFVKFDICSSNYYIIKLYYCVHITLLISHSLPIKTHNEIVSKVIVPFDGSTNT